MTIDFSGVERFYTHFLGRDLAYLFAGGLFISAFQYSFFEEVSYPTLDMPLELVGFLLEGQ